MSKDDNSERLCREWAAQIEKQQGEIALLIADGRRYRALWDSVACPHGIGSISCGLCDDENNTVEYRVATAPNLLKQRDDLLEALTALVDKLDAIDKTSNLNGIFLHAMNHGIPYVGPNYSGEIQSARTLIASIKSTIAGTVTTADGGRDG